LAGAAVAADVDAGLETQQLASDSSMSSRVMIRTGTVACSSGISVRVAVTMMVSLGDISDACV